MKEQSIIKPKGVVDVVLDTDTYNEIDDQYALAYLIRSSDKLKLKGIYAAPFSNKKCNSPGEGMEKSYEEIMNILELMNEKELKKIVKKGSREYLSDEKTPVFSEAAEDLIKRAKFYTAEKPLYVIAIGAITNIASALLVEPEIKEKIVLIWLGGHAYWWPDNKEFNLMQDIAAARIIFESGVSMVQLPCMGVVSSLTVSGPELRYHLKGKNQLCDYLVEVTEKEALKDGGNTTWTRAIWDVAAIAWLLDEEFEKDCWMHSPIPEYDNRYAFSQNRHLIKYVYHVDRDKIFEDVFKKLVKL